jgi:hypothetical protein
VSGQPPFRLEIEDLGPIRGSAIEQLHVGAVRLRWITDFLGLSPARWAGWLVVGQRDAPAGGLGPRQPVEPLPADLARVDIHSLPVDELEVGLLPEKSIDAVLGWDGARWSVAPT